MAANRPQRAYEFPTGYNQLFGLERFLIGENFFVHSQGLVVSDIFSLPFDVLFFPCVEETYLPELEPEHSTDTSGADSAIIIRVRA